MNERIKELLEHVGGYGAKALMHPDDVEKFAELIVRECAKICDELQNVPATEPRHCAEDIRKMFGVE